MFTAHLQLQIGSKWNATKWNRWMNYTKPYKWSRWIFLFSFLHQKVWHNQTKKRNKWKEAREKKENKIKCHKKEIIHSKFHKQFTHCSVCVPKFYVGELNSDAVDWLLQLLLQLHSTFCIIRSISCFLSFIRLFVSFQFECHFYPGRAFLLKCMCFFNQFAVIICQYIIFTLEQCPFSEIFIYFAFSLSHTCLAILSLILLWANNWERN